MIMLLMFTLLGINFDASAALRAVTRTPRCARSFIVGRTVAPMALARIAPAFGAVAPRCVMRPMALPAMARMFAARIAEPTASSSSSSQKSEKSTSKRWLSDAFECEIRVAGYESEVLPKLIEVAKAKEAEAKARLLSMEAEINKMTFSDAVKFGYVDRQGFAQKDWYAWMRRALLFENALHQLGGKPGEFVDLRKITL